MSKFKKSDLIYRNIKGIKYEHITSDPSEFERLKLECKANSKKYRIIKKEEFLIQVI